MVMMSHILAFSSYATTALRRCVSLSTDRPRKNECLFPRLHGKKDEKAHRVSIRGGNRDPAFMGVYDRPGDGKSQAMAAGGAAAGLIRTIKAIEQVVKISLRNALTGIGWRVSGT